jgi:transposase
MQGMLDYTRSAEKLAELRAAHRVTRNKREADCIKAVLALATGCSAEDVAEILQVEPNTVRNHFKRYRQGGIDALRNLGAGVGGSTCALDAQQLASLDTHLQENVYLSAKDIAHWVEETFGVSYTESGMTAVLHRLGYVYKKPKVVPGKGEAQAQREFLANDDKKINQNKGENDPVYFMDAVHRQHNPVLAYGWIKRGEEQPVATNTGRKRLNINGAIDLDRLEPVVRFDESINAESTIALFKQLEQLNVLAVCIYVICDNARYYRFKAVRDYLKTSRIELVFLPPYAPNRNLIERLWKFFKKKILYNRYYETFDEFRTACEEFFANPRKYHRELRALLTENFAIVG